PGDSLTLTATLTPANATGAVYLYDAGWPLGSAPVAGGRATFRLRVDVAGLHSFSASYSGDALYEAATGTVRVLVQVDSSRATLTLTSDHNPVALGSAVLFTAVLSPADAPGTITFSVDGSSRGTFVPVNGIASFGLSTLPSGDHSVRAHYSGGGRFRPSDSNAWTQTVLD